MVASFQRVDTCAAEFQADTPYMYSSYDGSDECEPTNNKKVRFDDACDREPNPALQSCKAKTQANVMTAMRGLHC